MYYNGRFLNLQLPNYLFAVSSYHEVVKESNQAITFRLSEFKV